MNPKTPIYSVRTWDLLHKWAQKWPEMGDAPNGLGEELCSLTWLGSYLNFGRSGDHHSIHLAMRQWPPSRRMVSFPLCSSLDQLATLGLLPKGVWWVAEVAVLSPNGAHLQFLFLTSLGLPRSKLSSKHGVSQLGAALRCICSHARHETSPSSSIRVQQPPSLWTIHQYFEVREWIALR